jgi:hypothetical protein
MMMYSRRGFQNVAMGREEGGGERERTEGEKRTGRRQTHRVVVYLHVLVLQLPSQKIDSINFKSFKT